MLRGENQKWTQEQREVLPDCIRDCEAQHILIEFKYTESLTQDAVRQAMGYEYFYRKTHKLKMNQVKIFILCAKTPRAERLKKLDLVKTELPGVYENSQTIAQHVTVLLLNELCDEPHNALVKAFASRKEEKRKAFALLEQFWLLAPELQTMLEGLQAVWSLPEGVKMDEVLTVEQVMEIGETRKRILLANLSSEELDAYINPEYKEKVHKQGIEEGIKEGIEEGKKTERIEMIIQLLKHRFETVPDDISETLNRCTLVQLQELLNPAMVTSDLDAFLSHIPQPDAGTEADSAEEGDDPSKADTIGNGAAEG